jgi:hypothetical protein
VSFDAITPCVASQRVFIVVISLEYTLVASNGRKVCEWLVLR